MAPSGTVLRVAVEENQSVSSGETLFELVNTGLDSGTTTVTAVWAERAGIVQDSTMAAGSSTAPSRCLLPGHRRVHADGEHR